MSIFLYIIIYAIMIYLVIAGVYQILLALSYFIVKNPNDNAVFDNKKNKFAILVPSHNEELLISDFCRNILSINYQKPLYDVYVIADNCTDNTASLAKEFPLNVLVRNNMDRRGKGHALEWALDVIEVNNYDAIIVLDADTTVDREFLNELNKLLNKGETAIQCYINVPNRTETWFTQLIFLSRTINDLLYHSAKYKLGLSSYLMGTGMCFHKDLINKMKWNAFSLSEDWEYYAKLIKAGYKVAFSEKAVIHQMETKSLSQATTQRLRWSSGRFYVLKNLGLDLFLKGIKNRNFVMFDSSLALLLPNWSLQINLIGFLLVLSVILISFINTKLVIYISAILMFMQFIIVLMGITLIDKPMSVIKPIMLAPMFLLWKLMIDFVCITKIYKGKEWIRTKRHIPKSD